MITSDFKIKSKILDTLQSFDIPFRDGASILIQIGVEMLCLNIVEDLDFLNSSFYKKSQNFNIRGKK